MDDVEALKANDDGGSGDRCSELARWERFLQRVALRVLLVEADHSTRQIITSLLQKCNYSVTAVSDGLKAWETLKSKATDLDLILTEVELPSISGFALLTLIMEHDVCKNIPVIMMSSHDSVSMVLKFMLKGAADFLIKPVRRNELTNLWQHVWRRHAFIQISRPPRSTTFLQEKLEIALQDNSTSSQSSGSVASSQKNNECREKLTKAQDASQLESSLKLSNIDVTQHEESSQIESESAKHNGEIGERSVALKSEAANCNKTLQSTDLNIHQDHCCAETKGQDEPLRAELCRANSNSNTEIHGCNDALIEPSRGAINLLATFEDLEKPTEDIEKLTNENCSFNGGDSTKFDFDSKSGLSLIRDCPGSSCKQASEATEGRLTLNHSSTSAFSWYSGNSKLLRPLFPTQSITSVEVNNIHWDSHGSDESSGNALDTTSQYADTSKNQESMTTHVIDQYGQFRPKLSNSQCALLPVIEFISDFTSNGHGNFFTSMFSVQSDVCLVQKPKPVFQKESSPFFTRSTSQSNPESHHIEQHRQWFDDTTCTPHKSELDHARHDSCVTGQSAGNSSCNDAASQINSSAYESIGSGSDGNATSTVIDKNNTETFGDSGRHNYEGFRGTNSRHSSQREAALAKCRLKRKVRCYEKKVRYQSRKRMAEQRPRVKGQFVRQVQHDHPVADAGGDS